MRFDRFSGRKFGFGDLYVMRPDGTGVRLLAKDNLSWAWSPDRSRILFAADSEIWLFTVRGGALTQLTSNAVDDDSPAWSPDGKRIVFVRGGSYADGTVLLMDLETRAVRAITPERIAWQPAFPVWSPDGRHVAFVAGFPERLFVVAVEGSARRAAIKRTRSFESIYPPVWSPNSQRVLFNAGPFGLRSLYDSGLSDGHELYSLHVEEGALKRLSRNDVADRLEDISPKGACLLVETGPVAEPSREGTYVLRADGTGRKRLPESVVESLSEAWSPDGRRVAVVRSQPAGPRIVVEQAHGRRPWRLTDASC